MKYVSWAAFYEGPSDALYPDVLLPRIIRDLVARKGIQLVEVPDSPAIRLGEVNRSVEKVANEACAFRDAYDVIFIHADVGGRGLEQGITDRADAYCTAVTARCGWPGERCITVTPRHETEAWLLADGEAVAKALGYNGVPAGLGLPEDARAAERLNDPKQVLATAIERLAGRRRAKRINSLFPAIAQRQRLELLRRSVSYSDFEGRLCICLRALGCIQ